MDTPEASLSTRGRVLQTIAKGLLFYMLVPLAVFLLLAGPVGSIVRGSSSAVLWVLLAGLGAVVLNWLVYTAVRRKRPSLLVLANGGLCLMVVLVIGFEALPTDHTLRSTLAVIGGYLTLAALYSFSLWCAAPQRNKAAHSTAIVIWVILFLFLCGMVYQHLREIEVGTVSVDTWIGIASFFAFILILCLPRILASRRRKAAFERLTAVAEGRIVQIIGETHLDLDDDPVTRLHARIQYAVDGRPYETRADIARITVRRFGRAAFVGQSIPVSYDPADPASAFVKKIDRHFFDHPDPDRGEEEVS